MDLESVYKGKRVFVTGHTGFKGAWLLAWLHKLGADVKGYALAPQSNLDLYTSIKGDQLCESIIADIQDKQRVQKELLSFKPDFIFHLAAQPLVRYSYLNPAETFSVNVQGTVNVLEALKFLQQKCIAVLITTDKVYYNREENYHYKEFDKLGGYDPYSASKACAEIVIDSYRNSFFNKKDYKMHKKSISVARAGNVIGGGDWASDRIIPDIIRALSSGKNIEIRNPTAIRPWQHVLEPLHGYLIMGAHQQLDPIRYSDAFNIGPYADDVLTVEQLVRQSIKHWGSGQYIINTNPDEPHEAGLLQLDISKALDNLDWKPKMTSEKAIEITLNWYKKFNRQPERSFEITISEIEQFNLK